MDDADLELEEGVDPGLAAMGFTSFGQQHQRYAKKRRPNPPESTGGNMTPLGVRKPPQETASRLPSLLKNAELHDDDARTEESSLKDDGLRHVDESADELNGIQLSVPHAGLDASKANIPTPQSVTSKPSKKIRGCNTAPGPGIGAFLAHAAFDESQHFPNTHSNEPASTFVPDVDSRSNTGPIHGISERAADHQESRQNTSTDPHGDGNGHTSYTHNQLFNGVQLPNGDMCYYQPSFVEDPWANIFKAREN
jgi:hypothetical protein